ncbi:MAG: CsgG/HfaB family protein [Candidatus Edwardsbacteria bacterium]|nr:CsgG/HfaB family protein [Candidatus Edwardsbacteria bacterium]
MKKTLMSAMVLIMTASIALAQAAQKTAVAVMPLRGSDISETESKFLTERLTIELQRTDSFDVLERDKMDEILKEQGFQQTGACDETACLVEAGRLLPVQKMVGGSAGKVGNIYSAQVRLIDLKTGKVEKTATRDYQGQLDFLLTAGMRESAEELAGILKPQEKVPVQQQMNQQTETMMRGFMEAQYEDKSKSKGWAIFWSVIPGCGNFYAKNYKAGVLFLTAGLMTQSLWVEKQDESKKTWGFIHLGVRVTDCVVAVKSVSSYNANLRKKLGLSFQVTPFDKRPALALSKEF